MLAKAPRRRRSSSGLAAIERDAFRVLADAHHAVAEVGVVALQREIDAHQRPADQVGGQRADQRIEERRPHHVAGDGDAAEDRQDEAAREIPQHDGEGDERQDLQEQVEREPSVCVAKLLQSCSMRCSGLSVPWLVSSMR